MKNKNLRVLAIIFVLVIVIGALIFFNLKNSNELIGGDKDSHGCLIPAGYSWNETEQACVREWSYDSDRYQNTSK